MSSLSRLVLHRGFAVNSSNAHVMIDILELISCSGYCANRMMWSMLLSNRRCVLYYAHTKHAFNKRTHFSGINMVTLATLRLFFSRTPVVVIRPTGFCKTSCQDPSPWWDT